MTCLATGLLVVHVHIERTRIIIARIVLCQALPNCETHMHHNIANTYWGYLASFIRQALRNPLMGEFVHSRSNAATLGTCVQLEGVKLVGVCVATATPGMMRAAKYS